MNRLGSAGEVDKVGDLPPDGLADRHRSARVSALPRPSSWIHADGDVFLGSSGWPRRRASGTRSGLTRHPRADLLQTAEDHPVVGLEPFLDRRAVRRPAAPRS